MSDHYSGIHSLVRVSPQLQMCLFGNNVVFFVANVHILTLLYNVLVL